MTGLSGWTFNVRSDTYLFGNEDFGIGVYTDKGKWWANVSTIFNVQSLGPFDTMDEAKQNGLDFLNQIDLRS